MKSKDVISPCCGAEIITSYDFDRKRYGYKLDPNAEISMYYVCSKCGKAIEETNNG